jgi:hypothetical protein
MLLGHMRTNEPTVHREAVGHHFRAGSVRSIVRPRSVDRLRRGQAAGPALQHQGLLTGHAPDDGQKPHRLAAHGTEEVIVAEVHGGSVQSGARPSVSTSISWELTVK